MRHLSKTSIFLLSGILAAGCGGSETIAEGQPFTGKNSSELTGYSVTKTGSVLIDGVKMVRPQSNVNAAPEVGAIPIEDNAWISVQTIWLSNDIYVCWENRQEKYKEDIALVKKSITDTWQADSNLKFIGWNQCRDNSVGIRILIEDSGPHVKGLGRKLDGLKNGMVLNFDYNNWSATCKSSAEQKNICTSSIAVHEFGHALGFAHENNRPDTPGECTLRQGGDGDLMLTGWDLDSVMNYCNPVYNNDGKLSAGDKYAVNSVYK